MLAQAHALVPALILVASCSGTATSHTQPAEPSEATAAGPRSAAADAYGPLEVGADYLTYTKVSTKPFRSPTHGNRFVEIYVNEIGAAAYQSDAELPVGTVIVKASWETDNGAKTDVAGPLFVMEKRAPGFDPEHQDWWYALHWERVPPSWVDKMGADQVYWRSPSGKVSYCSGCHDNYDREVGLPAPGYRAWEAVD